MKKFVFLVFFFPAVFWGQDSTKVNLSNPNATIYNHIYYLQNSSYKPKLAAKSIYGLKEKEAIKTAVKIKRVLDGKGLQIDFNEVPTNPNYKDSIGYSTYSKYVLFPNRMPQISVEKRGNQWYYSEETIQSIDELYNEVYPWYVEKVQDVMPGAGYKKFLGIELWQYISIVLLIIASWILFLVVKRIVFTILKKVLFRFLNLENKDSVAAIRKLAHPISLLVALALIDKIFPSLQFGLEINKWVILGINITATIFWIYVFLKLSTVVVNIYENYTGKTEGKLDDQLVPILKNFLVGLILVAGLFKMLVHMGVNVATLIAGLSIGGLAIAFASQDTVKNLIGTVMIFVDKPFHIGDWIVAGDVSGTVEEVGFRSTRIRAADTSIFQISNSRLSEMTINNKGLLLYRRYNTQLGIRYDTPPELIEAFVQGIRDIVVTFPDTRTEAHNVEFVGFGDSGLLIMVNVYFNSVAWGEEQRSKHKLHLAILKLAAALGVDFAFPSTTMMIEQFPEKKGFDMEYNTDPERIRTVVSSFLEEFKKENES